MLVGAVWLLSLTQTIVTPVITAAILASVLAPLVRWLSHHRIPRGAGAAIVLLLVVVAGALIALLVLGGISAQSGEIEKQLQGAATKVEGWLKDLGVSSQTAANAKSDASGSISSAFHFLLGGLGTGLEGARLARDLPLLHRAEPVLPAQGRPHDQALARASPRRAAAGRPHDQRPHDRLAARLLRGRDRRRGLQRRS